MTITTSRFRSVVNAPFRPWPAAVSHDASRRRVVALTSRCHGFATDREREHACDLRLLVAEKREPFSPLRAEAERRGYLPVERVPMRIECSIDHGLRLQGKEDEEDEEDEDEDDDIEEEEEEDEDDEDEEDEDDEDDEEEEWRVSTPPCPRTRAGAARGTTARRANAQARGAIDPGNDALPRAEQPDRERRACAQR